MDLSKIISFSKTLRKFPRLGKLTSFDIAANLQICEVTLGDWTILSLRNYSALLRLRKSLGNFAFLLRDKDILFLGERERERDLGTIWDSIVT